MKHRSLPSAPGNNNAIAARVIGRLLHDPHALETSFADVVKTIRLFTDGDADADILQEALLRVFSSNLTLRVQVLDIARQSHISVEIDGMHQKLLPSDAGESDRTVEPRASLGSDHALHASANQPLVTRAAPTVATLFRPTRVDHHHEAEASVPIAIATTVAPAALLPSTGAADELHLSLVQKLIINLLDEATAPASTVGTDGRPLPA